MPTATPRRRKLLKSSASADRVKQLLVELTYRLHTTRVVGVKQAAGK